MKNVKTSGSAKTKDTPVGKVAVRELHKKPFPIVGFGASAGGLEAFTILLKYLDSNLGMAYVLIMHLSPNHKSALTEILQSKTKMTVHTVRDGMKVKPDNIYVIPPNTFMSLVDGRLKLAPRAINNFAVDYFLTALASNYKNNAIGVILSGTATDGTLGLKAIKAGGGITFAQDETAKFSGMPHNAYHAGYVDFLLPPEGIANELAHLVKMLPYTTLPFKKKEWDQEKEVDDRTEELKKVLSIVKSKSGVDFFQHYKRASIYRRVVRRMVLNKFEKLEDYGSMLKASPKEVDALYDDFLINVTNFFRDPDFYRNLTKNVFPSIAKQVHPLDPIRIWVAGCSTGEEAYSIAICLIEFLEKKELTMPIQIFASDLDANAIEKARVGIYQLSALQEVSQDHLRKYFVKIEGHYQIVKSVREICIFSQHNLLRDPPFSRIDLISCQNVLIYLESSPQKKILQTFHYALKPSGYLFLGKSETIGTSDDLFEALDKRVKLYSRKPASTPQLEFTIHNADRISPKVSTLENSADDIEKVMGKQILSRFVYPSVVVNKNLMIIQFFGAISQYLEPVTGKASFNILKMIREDLVIELGNLLQESRKTETIVIKEGIKIYNKKTPQEIAIEIVPKRISGNIFFLVVFRTSAVIRPVPNHNGAKSNGKSDQKDKTILKLEEELVQSRALIRSTHEEYETTYEELQANNEEILSSNEELQSVNEELETSKEELQSAIEELTTTNEELRKRNIELDDSQKELRKVNEQLAEFAFISSHDLQEPLRKIATFSDLLSKPEGDLNEYAKKYSDRIGASASRMSDLIKDLLTFTALVKKDDRTFVKVDLNETLKNVIEDFEGIIDRRKATINLSSLPAIPAEPVQMNQLFHNLLSNALKFSKENPVITVSSREVTPEDLSTYPELRKDVHYVSISVNDNGIGFDQIYADKIFTLFQRLRDKKEIGGTGVGLTICKKIVEDHGGFIFAKGIKNVGATFTIFMPAEQPVNNPAANAI